MSDRAQTAMLSRILHGDADGIRRMLEDGTCRAEVFAQFARRHHVAGFCFATLQEAGLLDLFPGPEGGPMRSGYIQQWSKNERLIHGMSALERSFDEAGIEAVWLKGPLFAQRYYGDIDRRAISDIDVLVRQEDVESAGAVLGSAGFERRSAIFLSQPLTVFFTHHFEYGRDDVVVELHWCLARHVAFRIDYPRVWRGQASVTHDDTRFRVLSDEYELVTQILSILKDVELGTIALKSLIDVYKILEACHERMDWRSFLDRRGEEGLFRIALNVLDLVLDLLDGRQDFGNLAGEIDLHRELIGLDSREDKIDLVCRARSPWRRRRWASRLYEAPYWKTAAWWAGSLPFRLAVYRKA